MQATFDGRVLFLSQDAGAMRRQLAGEDLTLAQAQPLRDDVSAGDIAPAWNGFSVLVAGRRCGQGSSFEANPDAGRPAGIRLVIAESFERICRQDCHNLGLLTSTDFGLVERIRHGEAIAIEEFTRGEDPLTAEIIRRGGLFPFTRARLAGEGPTLAPATLRPMTYAEKILTRARPAGPVRCGRAMRCSRAPTGAMPTNAFRRWRSACWSRRWVPT